MLAKEDIACSSSNFANLIRSCLLSGDVISAVEALQQMDVLGMQFTHVVSEAVGGQQHRDKHQQQHHQQQLVAQVPKEVRNESQYESIRALMVSALTSSEGKAALDELYYALVSVAESGGAVPRLALDAIVEATGRLDLNDRSFATFEEYEPVFGVRPDIHSFNALLASCACARSVNMDTLLSIFQQIETSPLPPDSCLSGSSAASPNVSEEGDESGDASPPSQCVATVESAGSHQPSTDLALATEGTGALSAVSPVAMCAPNKQSFTILLEAMVDSGDFQILDEVLLVAANSGLQVSNRALRRLVVSFAKKADWERVHRLRVQLREQEGGRESPLFLKTRVSNIRLAAEAAAAAAAPVIVKANN